MMRPLAPRVLWPLIAFVLPLAADENKNWLDLSGGAKPLEMWEPPTEGWEITGSAAMDPHNPRFLTFKPGGGVLVNGPKGRARNLLSKQKFTDVELHLEFMVPRGSNSGVKLAGLYEIQVLDSHEAKELTGAHCGGIYPRAEEQPKYHHIDKGVPPKVNACKPAGEWQTLEAVFQAPRFDADGKKTANARFVKVLLNGQLIHENVDVAYPTGAAWRLRKEAASGPILLQADHGPVAFRNVRVRPCDQPKK